MNASAPGSARPKWPIREITENSVAKVPGQWATSVFSQGPPSPTLLEQFEKNGWTPKFAWPPVLLPDGRTVTIVYFKCEGMITIPGMAS